MKYVLTLLALSVFSFGSIAKADTVSIEQLTRFQLQVLAQDLAVPYLINWKVGDSAEMSMSLGAFGSGKMLKSVTKDEGATLWYRQDVDMLGQKQVMDIQLDKNDGKVLKLLVNGKEEKIPDDKIEVVSQEYTEITVPAGKFKAVHVVAKTKDAKVELWANPRDTVMDGGLKLIQGSQFGDITLELLSFKRAP